MNYTYRSKMTSEQQLIDLIYTELISSTKIFVKVSGDVSIGEYIIMGKLTSDELNKSFHTQYRFTKYNNQINICYEISAEKIWDHNAFKQYNIHGNEKTSYTYDNSDDSKISEFLLDSFIKLRTLEKTLALSKLTGNFYSIENASQKMTLFCNRVLESRENK